MNKITKWIVKKLGGVDPVDVKPHESMLTKTELTPVKVGVTISTPEDDMKLQQYDEWEKDRAAYGIGYEIINSGFFERVEMYDVVSNTMMIKYTVEVLKKGIYEEDKNDGERIP